MAFFLINLAIAAISAGAAYISAKKAKDAVKNSRGSTLNKNSNIEPIPVLYGKRRLGGTRVFVSTKDVEGGDPNEYLYIALVLCEGEVESIEDIEIDGHPITGASTPGDRFYNLLSIEKFYGTDDQAASTILQESGASWTTNHRLRGVAYLAVRLKFYHKSFSGMPEITAVVEGKKVYDPRTEATGYSTNPALCILDYLTNTRYGKGLSDDVIDEDAFIAAADDCDNFLVDYVEGGDNGKIFECNALLDTEETVFANLQSMLLGCRGFLPYTQGQYGLIIDQATDSVFDFTTDNIVGGIQIKGESKSDKYNRVICKFINPEANWQEDTAVYPDAGSAEETTFLAEDGGTLLQGEFDLDTITNYYAARDFARIFLRRSRNAMRVAFTCTSEALQLSVADVVSVTHPTPGFEEKPFQVEEITLNYDGTCNVSLLEYDSTIYTYDPSAEQTTYPDTILPDPFTVAAPTDLAVTEYNYIGEGATLFQEVIVSWTASADSFVIEYELQYKQAEAETWQSRPTREPRMIFNSAVIGQEYDVRVRAFNTIGSFSDWVETSYTVDGEIDALDPPAEAPTGLDLTAEVVLNTSGEYVTNLVFTFTAADDSRISSYEAQYQLARHGGNWKSLYNSPKSRHEWSTAELGTYQVRVRSVYLEGRVFSDWAETSVTSLGTYSALATIGISDPVDPKLFISTNADKTTADIRISVGFADEGVKPDRFLLFYSAAEVPNALDLGADTGTKLYRKAGAGISGTFDLPVTTGSSTTRVRYTNTSSEDIDLSGRWWMQIESGVSGTTQYYKISESSPTELYMPPGVELPFTPQSGDTIHIVETDFADSRLPEFNLIWINGEVVRHSGIEFDGQYYFVVEERGAEGTTQADQTGGTAHYFPALGPLTNTVEIMASEFSEIDGVYVYSGTIPVNIPANMTWASISGCFARKTTNGADTPYLRSNIVDLTIAGPA